MLTRPIIAAVVTLASTAVLGVLIGRAYEQQINRPQPRAIHTVCQGMTPCIFHEYKDIPVDGDGYEYERTHRSWAAARWAIDDDDTLMFWRCKDDEYWDSIVIDLQELAEQNGHLVIDPDMAAWAMNEEARL